MDYATEVANALELAANLDAKLRAQILSWWNLYRNEYRNKRKRGKYKVLARANITNWIGKLLFANVLQSRDSRARVVAQFGENISPREALDRLGRLSEECNFHTVFSDDVGLSVVPKGSWTQLLQFNRLLSDLRIGSVDQGQLAILLEAVVEVTVRKVRGQFATPPALAQLIAALALRDILGDKRLDPCCGSGTIARAAFERKLEHEVPLREAAAAVYAGDQDPLAVQIATLARVKPSLMNIALRIFCKNAFDLQPSTDITFYHPRDGSCFIQSLPSFNAIASNLPFVSQGGWYKYKEGMDAVNQWLEGNPVRLSGRSDVSADFPFAWYRLLASRGRLVMIISNSWLSTDWGDKFYSFTSIAQYYNIKAIVISGSGR